MENKIVAWSATAFKQFELAIKFIANDSLKNAEKVKNKLQIKLKC